MSLKVNSIQNKTSLIEQELKAIYSLKNNIEPMKSWISSYKKQEES